MMWHIITNTLCLLLPVSACADVLWDNGEFRGQAGISSERNTSVAESWTVDDIILAEPVVVRGFEWFTLVTDDLDAVASDLVVLDSGFQPLIELRDLSFTRTLEGVAYGLDYYRVTLAGLFIELAPGRYYIGARIVGSGQGACYTGLDAVLFGETEGYFRSEFFGWPDWVPVSNITGRPYDVCFKVYGDVIPAPATLAVLLPGLVVPRRRR